MQGISIVCRATPIVSWPQVPGSCIWTFEGLRESMTIADKLKPVQIVLPAAQARDLAQQLAAVLPPGG